MKCRLNFSQFGLRIRRTHLFEHGQCFVYLIARSRPARRSGNKKQPYKKHQGRKRDDADHHAPLRSTQMRHANQPV
jgi:hypothetical protein